MSSELIESLAGTDTLKPELEPAKSTGLEAHKQAQAWPSLDDAALHGLPGDIIRTLEPHTEADPVAILVQLLTQFGSAIGRGSYAAVEADRHGTNIFCNLVGATAGGRKGVSFGQARRPLAKADPEWANDCIVSGLSSGEGLIWRVRDEIQRQDPIKEKGRVTGYETVVIDPGIEDKRLLVYESELAQALRVSKREGSTLSPTVRNAWDSGNLSTLTKNNAAKATDAHISIIGHITREELLKYLDDVETANGFANRFLWICVRRSKYLAEGGNLQDRDLDPLVARLDEAIKFGKQAGEIKRDNEAKKIWGEVYPELSEGRPGLVGAITARAEAQVMRLAVIYAVIDNSYFVKRPHLEAALAVWEYAENSVHYIFGESLGDPDADLIYRALCAKAKGITRTDISGLFQRNKSTEQINRALTVLYENDLAEPIHEPTKGRSVERWVTKQTNNTNKAIEQGDQA